MRRINRKQYPIKAYVTINNEERGFWCRVEKKRVVSTDIGQEMEGTNKVLYTLSDYEFKVNHKIRFDREQSYSNTVDAVDSIVNSKNNSARRGNPIFETRLDIS